MLVKEIAALKVLVIVGFALVWLLGQHYRQWPHNVLESFFLKCLFFDLVLLEYLHLPGAAYLAGSDIV